MAVLLAAVLLLQPPPVTPFTHAVAARCTGEGSHPQAIRICACTVKHRLEAGWSERNVLSAYYAPDVPPSEEGLVAAAAGLDGACQGEEYFLMGPYAARYFDLEWAVAEVHWDGKAVYAFRKSDWGRRRSHVAGPD